MVNLFFIFCEIFSIFLALLCKAPKIITSHKLSKPNYNSVAVIQGEHFEKSHSDHSEGFS